MLTASYPRIGTIVRFVRQIPQTGLLVQGSATVEAICMDANKRLVAHLCQKKEDGQEERFNVDLKLLNPSDECIATFQTACDEVKKLTDEGNKAAAEIVGSYNKMIDGVFDGILGKPVEFEAV